MRHWKHAEKLLVGFWVLLGVVTLLIMLYLLPLLAIEFPSIVMLGIMGVIGALIASYGIGHVIVRWSSHE